MKYVLTDAAVRKLRGVLAPRSGNTGAGGAATPVSPDDYPAPYTVRWSQSENNGAGAWVIWFPTENTYKNIQNPVLMVGTIRITAGGVTNANTLPLGWKILPNTAAGGDVWLRVDVPRGAGLDDPDWTSNISATFKTADDTPPYNPTDLYTHYAIPIAKAWTDQSGTKLVRQYVTSLVKLSVNTDKEGGDGGSGGGDDDGEFLHPFEVRWAPNETHPSQQGADAGSWVIWLPDPYQVAWDDDGSLAPAAGVTLTPCATLPSGWYMIGRVRPRDSEVWVGYNSARRTYGLSRSTLGLSQPWLLVATMDTSTKAVTQYVDSALFFSDDEGVTPDDVSTEFIPDPPSGTTPDGDEGKLQIKGFKSGQPADTNTIAEYLMGTAQTSGQVWLIVRGQSTGGDPVLGYLPLDALNLYEYAKKNDLPTVNDGTLTIKQGTTTLGTFTANQATPATVTIPKPPTPPSGTVEFVADVDWYVDGSVHQLRKRLRVLDLATGNVTDKARTTYANGWEVLTNTTPISSIIGS